MSVTSFGTYVAIRHVALENDIIPTDLHDISVELAIWLHAKLNEDKWRDSGMPDGTLNGPRSFLGQTKMRDLAERSLVASLRGFRPELCTSFGNLTSVGSALAQTLGPLVDQIAEQSRSAWEPTQWTQADELFLTAGIPVTAIRILNLFYVAVTKTERAFLDARRASEPLDDVRFRIPGVNILLPQETAQSTNNFIKLQEQALPAKDPNAPQDQSKVPFRSIPTFTPTPTSVMNNSHRETTQHFDETSTYLMQAAVSEGSHWQAWVPVSVFQPSTRNLMRYLYRLGLVDLRAFNTQGRGRPRLIIRTSSVGERLLRHLAQEKML